VVANRAEHKPDGDTQRNIMEDNTQPRALGDPDGKPQAALVYFFSDLGSFFSLIIFIPFH